MAEFVLTTPTEVAVGAAVPYNHTIVPGCCDIRHRSPGVITIKGSGCCKCPKKYDVNFHAVVTGVAGAMQLGIYLDGELLPETFMSVNSGAAANEYSVDAATVIPADCGCQRISVRVITGDDVTVNTAAIIVNKEA